jgi:hypothetical protein
MNRAGVVRRAHWAAVRWALVGFGGLLATSPGVATAQPLVTGQGSAAVKGVKCIPGGPTFPPSNVVKLPVFNSVGPNEGPMDTGAQLDTDQWCGGAENHEDAQATLDTTKKAMRVISRITSEIAQDPADESVFPVAVSSASLTALMNIVPAGGNPPEGFAYVKVRAQTRFAGPSGPPCGPVGSLVPCREAKITVGSPAEAVNHRTIPVASALLEDRSPTDLTVPLKLKRQVMVPPFELPNRLELPLQVEAHVTGNGDVVALAILQKIELPRGWGFAAPFRQVPAAEDGLPNFDPFAVVVAGQAVPAPEGSVLISPPTGTLAPDQAFDLALVVQTAGQTITALTAFFDGADVSGAVAGCGAAHPGALTGGTPGEVIRCPGLTAGVLGPGTHTLSVSVSLSGGATLTDSATWTVLGGAVGPPPAPGPSVEVSPPPGVYTETQAFDLVLVADLQGRTALFAQITFDEIDVTGPVIGCSSIGSVPTGQVILRCPGLSGALLGPGTHIFRITLFLDDGSPLIDGAVWEILSATGA